MISCSFKIKDYLGRFIWIFCNIFPARHRHKQYEPSLTILKSNMYKSRRLSTTKRLKARAGFKRILSRLLGKKDSRYILLMSPISIGPILFYFSRSFVKIHFLFPCDTNIFTQNKIELSFAPDVNATGI